MKIGVYIGSFNPVHLIHQKIVNNLIEKTSMEKVIVIPTGDNYHLKNNLISFEDRFNMLKLAFPYNNVIVSDMEKDEYHYTFQNIGILKEKYPKDDLYLVIGADNLFELNTWKNYTYLLENCNFIVYGRNDLNIQSYINNNFTNYKIKFIIKEQIGSLSSTLIRNSIKNNKDIDLYLCEPVKNYILKKHLYKGD